LRACVRASRGATRVLPARMLSTKNTFEEIKAWAAANKEPEFPPEWEMNPIEDDTEHFDKEAQSSAKYVYYGFIPVMGLGLLLIIDEKLFGGHHAEQKIMPYMHVRTTPFPWKHECSFLDFKCHKAHKAGVAPEEHGHGGHH